MMEEGANLLGNVRAERVFDLGGVLVHDLRVNTEGLEE